MDDFSVALARLETRLETLEGRVASLEHSSEASAVLPALAPILEIAAPSAVESSSFAEAGATFPVFGKAMLGMAGAYLLRAVAESGSFPKLAVVALAIAYAGMWLIWSARVPASAWFAGATYATTSALILAPMLWELTLRFNVLSPSAAAAVLGVFVLSAFALAWRRNLTSIAWMAALTSAIASIALLIATHDMLPFLFVLLGMAALTEAASIRNRWFSLRPVVAAAADIATWALLYIYTNPDASRADYAILSPSVLLAPASILLFLYATSIALRTILLRRTISLFEAGQVMIAFLLAADALLHFGQSATLFGIFCLLLAPACYASGFLCFDRASMSRNYHVYATWGLAFTLAGCFLCLPLLWLASCLAMAAILTTLLGVQRSRLTLKFHGLVYLVAAALASGLLRYAAHAMAGTFPQPPLNIAWVVAGSAILCYAIGGQFPGTLWKKRPFQTLSATLAVGAVATLLVSALVWLTAHIVTPGESHVAVIRTLTACALVLLLAHFGPRWQRVELVWIAYGTLALVAAKLLLEDLRQGHPEFIAASIFLYAVTVMLVPGLVRRSSKKITAISLAETQHPT